MEITTVERRWHDSPEFTVRYSGLMGDGRFHIHATDELDAFKRGTQVLKEREMNERITIVSITISVLVLLATLTYACTTPSFRETCVAAGKRYVNTTIQSAEVPDIEACI